MKIDIDYLREWEGKTEEAVDVVTKAPIQGILALLDQIKEGQIDPKDLPLASHWLYFLPRYSQSQIGPDGHKLLGEFLPPVTLPRRMWAGGCIQYKGKLSIGDEIKKSSCIKKVKHASGKSGDLVFVVVNHIISCGNQLLIEEDHDIVYRSAPTSHEKPPKEKAAPKDSDWSRIIKPDPVLLFRYSALTFNSHRIHYDRKYAMEEEGYPGLVVHGPLLATLLLDLINCEMPSCKVKIFDYRAIRPVFDTANFVIKGKLNGEAGAHLWVETGEGNLAMTATVKF